MTDLHIATDWPVTEDFIDVLRAIQAEDFPMITSMDVLTEEDMFTFDGEILVMGNPDTIKEVYNVDVTPFRHVVAPSIKETFWTAGGATKLRYALSRIVSGLDKTREEIPYGVIYPADHDQCGWPKGERAFVDIEVSGDIKTDGPEHTELISVAIRINGKTMVFSRECLELGRFRRYLAHLLQANKIVLHNGAFDCRWLNYHLREVLEAPLYTDDDTMLMHHSMFHGAGEHGLKQLCQRIFGAPEWEADARKYTKAGSHYELIPPELLYKYNAGDVYWTEQLYLYLRKLMDTRPEAEKCYRETELPASHMLQDVTTYGMPVDLEYAAELDKLLEGQIALAQERLNLFGGKEVEVVKKATKTLPERRTKVFKPFNANSPLQVKEWFVEHGERNLSSADEKHLMAMHIKGRHMGMIEAILEYRGNSKARSTYVTGVLAKVDANARVHPTFKVHGTSTGRLASSGPNIQNVSNDQEGKPSLRRMYRTHTAATVFVGCDYAQAELRVMAELSNDPRMIGDLQADSPDFFTNMLPFVFPLEDFTTMHPRVMKKFRLKLKRVVYGSSYGLSAGSVAQMLTLEGSPTSRDEAQSIQDGYLGIYPGLRHWRDYTMQDNRESNLLTPFGRQLQLDVITDATFNRARNQAWAFKPQSIASDICVHAALDLHYNILPDLGAHLAASVHDALYAESPVGVAEEVKLAIETAMTASAAKIYHRVPFPTDGHISRNWNEC
jgi:DNA polymerase I-like protein with 3'-5' exonuclease and polymerase domains